MLYIVKAHPIVGIVRTFSTRLLEQTATTETPNRIGTKSNRTEDSAAGDGGQAMKAGDRQADNEIREQDDSESRERERESIGE